MWTFFRLNLFFLKIRGLFSRLAKAKREKPLQKNSLQEGEEEGEDDEAQQDFDTLESVLVAYEAEQMILNDFVPR